MFVVTVFATYLGYKIPHYVFSSALLQKVLNPPDPDAIEDALESLVQIHALEKTSSGRYEPTFYGCLLNSLPLSFDSSVLTLKFCELGAVHEGILISIMLDIQPLPILQPFGYQALVCFNWVMDHPSSPVPSVVVDITCHLFYSARSTETITSKEMAVYKLAKRKLLPLEIFVHFNFGSVFLR